MDRFSSPWWRSGEEDGSVLYPLDFRQIRWKLKELLVNGFTLVSDRVRRSELEPVEEISTGPDRPVHRSFNSRPRPAKNRTGLITAVV